MTTPVILTARDFEALFADPNYMTGCIDALEAAVRADYEGSVRTKAIADEASVDGRPSTVRTSLVAGQGRYNSLLTIGSGGGVSSRFLCLLDGVTRELVALMDSGLLNPLRVGAEGGLGAKYLASPGAKVAGVLGSSKQAVTQIAGLCCAMRELDYIKVYSPTKEHRDDFAAKMASWLGRRIEPVDSAEEAIRDSDVVDLVNNAGKPIFETSWLKPGALVMAISGRGEVPVDFLTETRVVAPSWQILSTSPVREPFLSAVKSGTYTREDYAGDLGAIMAGAVKARNAPSDIVDFEATAMPVLEHAATEWAFEWAKAAGVGKPFSLVD